MLALPDFHKPFSIEIDASDLGIGADLQQEGHPLAFVSKAIDIKYLGLSAYEKEYMAILLAVEHWRAYLLHAKFYIYTDHRSLSHLYAHRLHTPWQQKVFTKLLGLQYRIIYKKGVENNVNDTLSRRPHPERHLFALSSVVPAWLQEVESGYQDDLEASKLLTSHAMAKCSPYCLQDGLIRYKGRLWLGSNSTQQTKVLAALHSSALGGHSRFLVTYKHVKHIFYWPHMKRLIKEYVYTCTVCHQAKPDRGRYPGLLQHLPVLTLAWQSISLDFIDGLSRSASYNTILMVVDRLSKCAHFIPLHHPFIALKVAQVSMSQVYRLHGILDSIVSDRDKVFTSHFWQELFKLSGTPLLMSLSYHPETNGQTKRVNQCLETYLC